MNAKIYGAMLCLGMFALVGLTFSASVARGSEVIHDGGEGKTLYEVAEVDLSYSLYSNPSGPTDGYIIIQNIDWGDDPSFGAFAYAGMGYVMEKTTYPDGSWSAYLKEVDSICGNETRGDIEVLNNYQSDYDTSGTGRIRTLTVYYWAEIGIANWQDYQITTDYDTGPGGPL